MCVLSNIRGIFQSIILHPFGDWASDRSRSGTTDETEINSRVCTCEKRVISLDYLHGTQTHATSYK